MAMAGKPGERMAYHLTGLPDINEYTALYNDKLAKFLTLTKAIEYNYDPASMERTGWFDVMGEAVLNRMTNGLKTEPGCRLACTARLY